MKSRIPSLFNKLKHLSRIAADQSSSIAKNLWQEYGDIVTEKVISALQGAAALGKKSIANEETFRKTLDVVWEQMPWQVQIVGRKRFDRAMLGLRDKVFLIEGDTVRVHPEAKEKIAPVLKAILDRKGRSPGPSGE